MCAYLQTLVILPPPPKKSKDKLITPPHTRIAPVLLKTWKREGTQYCIGAFCFTPSLSALHADLTEVGTSDRIAIFQISDSYRTEKKQLEYWSSKAIVLQISDYQNWTSDCLTAIGLAETYRTKRAIFTLFLCIFSWNFAVLMSFSQISAKTQELLHQYCFWLLCCSWRHCCCLHHCCCLRTF